MSVTSFSFDVVSKVDLQELDNAINQANKEISQRYDFKGSVSQIELKEEQLILLSDDEMRLRAVIDVLQSKLIKRQISLKALSYGKIEPAAKGTVRQTVDIKQGIDKEAAKIINNMIKDSKIKVNSQIQGEQLRVTGKSKDDLQTVIQMLKSADLEIELQFVNFR